MPEEAKRAPIISFALMEINPYTYVTKTYYVRLRNANRFDSICCLIEKHALFSRNEADWTHWAIEWIVLLSERVLNTYFIWIITIIIFLLYK